MEDKEIGNCIGFPTPTKVEAPLGIYGNNTEADRYWSNLYASVIGTMLYLASNTIPDIYFAVIQCARFTHNTKASHEIDTNIIFWYLQVTKYNGLVFNQSNKMLVAFYADAYFLGLWGNEISQNTIFVRSKTVFVVSYLKFSSLVGIQVTDKYFSL